MRLVTRFAALACTALVLPGIVLADTPPISILVKPPHAIRKDTKTTYRITVTNRHRKTLKEVELVVDEPDWLFFRKAKSEDGKCHLEFAKEGSGELNKILCEKITIGGYQSATYTITFDATFDQTYCNNTIELWAHASAKNTEEVSTNVTNDITCPLL